MEELVASIEERNVIQAELGAGSDEPARKKRFLSDKSIAARQKNPTNLDENLVRQQLEEEGQNCLKLHVKLMEVPLAGHYQE